MSNWNKLKGLSADELKVRLAQKWSGFAERRGVSSIAKLPDDRTLFSSLLTGPINSPKDLLNQFRTRFDPQFFAGFDDKTKTTKVIKSRWTETSNRIIDEANRLVEGRFDLLGFTDLSFGMPIDWHLEPLANKRTPLNHWSQLNYLDAAIAGDKKIIWELNRHQYFAKLGEAYWLTGDERYANAFVSHVNSWMDQNPPKLGINWASSLEVSFRAISWIWALYFFKNSDSLNASFFSHILKFLYLHARHLETYLSTYFSPNTHLTGEALGLFYIGTMFPEFKESSRWKMVGKAILIKWLPIHVLPDGVYFEQASYYHRYTTDFYIHFLSLLRANGESLPTSLEEKLASLLDHLMYLARPDGTSPLFGDDDGGRLVMLDERDRNDFRASLSTGAAIFRRGDYKFSAGRASIETLWLTGMNGLDVFDQLETHEPRQQSVAFNDGGYYVLRDGWTSESNYLFFDCGPHGYANCGHAHADALAFELVAGGRTVLVDPGTFTYTGSKDSRDWFRSSGAHNTVTIAGRSSSVTDGPFSWRSTARCFLKRWINQERFDFVSGEHDGYFPASHERSILFLKRDYWVVRDHVEVTGTQDVDINYHFSPTSNPIIEATGDKEPGFISDIDNDCRLDISVFSDTSEHVRWRRQQGWVSTCYGKREPSRIYAYSDRVTGSRNFVSFLLPGRADERMKVRQIEAVGGLAFELVQDGFTDLLMIRTAPVFETALMSTDFEWSWFRFIRSDSSVPEEMVLLNGSSLNLRGRQVLNNENKLQWVAAKRLDSSFVAVADVQIPSLNFAESWFTS